MRQQRGNSKDETAKREQQGGDSKEGTAKRGQQGGDSKEGTFFCNFVSPSNIFEKAKSATLHSRYLNPRRVLYN